MILVLAMILSISTTAFATPNQPQKAQITQESTERMIAQQEGNSDVEIQVSPGAVAVFVLGILAGYVIDGIVGCKALTISFSGLLGGHSGVGINKGHANALVSIATLLAMLRQGGVSYRVASFSGGQAKNAIPAFGTATVVLSAAEEDRAKAIIETFRGEFAEAFGNIEPDMVFTTAFGDTAPDRVLTGEIGYGMVGLMTTVPNNVHTMSPFIDGLVESSANLGVVSVDDDMVRFTVFARSSVAYMGQHQIGSAPEYRMDRSGNLYMYLERLNAAVEAEGVFACDAGGHPPVFSAVCEGTRFLPVYTYEEAVERLEGV